LLQFAIENGPVEIVDLAIKNGGFPYSFVSLPEGKLWYLNTSDDQILDDLPLISIAIVQWLCYQRITHCTSGPCITLPTNGIANPDSVIIITNDNYILIPCAVINTTTV
jgi:hypothetical protein